MCQKRALLNQWNHEGTIKKKKAENIILFLVVFPFLKVTKLWLKVDVREMVDRGIVKKKYLVIIIG